MLRHKPIFKYNGLTIVLSNPSRFDNQKLLSAGGGRLIDEFLQPEYNRMMCDIRIAADQSELLDDTKCILLLGDGAIRVWIRNLENSLGEIRGSVFYKNEVPMIASFFPQDAADIRNHEKEFNKQLDISEDDIDDNEIESEIGEKSRHGRTKRKNYRFWLQKDIEKCKTILKSGVPKRPIEPEYIIAPNANDIIKILSETKGKELFIDIESWYPSCDIKCLAFSFDRHSTVYSFPWFSHDYSWAYSSLPSILRALAIGIRDNITIAHNGAAFDFFVLAWKYKIPIGKNVKDTMIMMHRCYSDVEKSLGHCTSLWTWEMFHKDEGNIGYNTPAQVRQTLEYCAKDVFTMKLIYYAMLEYSRKIPGLLESFNRANSAIRPYLTCTLQGIQYDEGVRKAIVKENDLLMMQYLRMLRILIGDNTLKEIAGKSKKPLPGSNKQCVEYFHERLGYPVVARGMPRQDGSRGPSLGKKAMFKLRLKFDNPVIDIILAYRECQTETGYLKFLPFDVNKTYSELQPKEQLELV